MGLKIFHAILCFCSYRHKKKQEEVSCILYQICYRVSSYQSDLSNLGHWFLKKMWESEGNPEKGALDDQRDGLWIQGNV